MAEQVEALALLGISQRAVGRGFNPSNGRRKVWGIFIQGEIPRFLFLTRKALIKIRQCLSQIDITVYLLYYLVSVFIVSFDNVIYTCCHLAITSVFSRAALPIMGNKQLHVKWPRALLRFISVRLENPNKIAIAILSSTFWCRNPGLFIP